MYVDDWGDRAVFGVGEGISLGIPGLVHGVDGHSLVGGRRGRRRGVITGRKHRVHEEFGLAVLLAMPAMHTTESGQ